MSDVEMRQLPFSQHSVPSYQLSDRDDDNDIDPNLLRSSIVRDNGVLATRENHESTWLLLFVDLLFVAFAIQTTQSMTVNFGHAVLLDRPETIVYTIMIHLCIFLAFFCIWVDTQIFFTRVPLASVRDLVLFMVELLGAFMMVLSVASATAIESSSFGIEWGVLLNGLMLSRGFSLIAWVLWWRAQNDDDDEWVFCQWTVRVKCGAYFGVLAMWGSHNLRNLLIGLATGSPAFSSGEELALGFAVFFLGLVDLVVRTWPGTPGQIASMATVGEGAWQELMKRCGDVTMLLLGEPIIRLGGASNTPQCDMLTSHSSRYVAVALVFTMALLYFGSQPTCLKRHVLARSVPGSLAWLALHGLLGFTLLLVSAALSIGLHDVHAARAGLGVCRASATGNTRFCECLPTREACLSSARSSGGASRCAWVSCNQRNTEPAEGQAAHSVEFCAAFLPESASTSCFLEVARRGGDNAQFFANTWSPFPFVEQPDPRAENSFWNGRDRRDLLLIPGAAGHHGPGPWDGPPLPSGERVEAGPEAWHWLLTIGLTCVNLEIFLLRAMHKDLDFRETWLSLVFRLLMCVLPWFVGLGVVSQPGADLLCEPKPHHKQGSFEELVSFYATLLCMQIILVGFDVASNIQIRRAIERKAKSVRHLRLQAGFDAACEGRERSLSTPSAAALDSALAAFVPTVAPGHASVYFGRCWGPAVYRMTPGFEWGSLHGSAFHTTSEATSSVSALSVDGLSVGRSGTPLERRSSAAAERRATVERRLSRRSAAERCASNQQRLSQQQQRAANLSVACRPLGAALSGRLSRQGSTPSMRSGRNKSVKFEDEVEPEYGTEPDTRESSLVASERL